MDITIKYFGLLAEITHCTEETISFSKGTAAELLSILYNHHPNLLGKDFKVAQQMELIDNNTKITATEIALLPPFSGG